MPNRLSVFEPRGPARMAAAFMALLAAIFLVVGSLRAEVAGNRTVVVELFTSQGCNSCPPADALLSELAGSPDLLALSLHVDYWDYIGWKDPFGSPMNTQRQRRYADSLGLRYVFTPQIVIDGRTRVVGSHRAEVREAIREARERPPAVEIGFDHDGGGRVIVSAGEAPEVGATVWLAVYDRRHETDVSRGENAGRTIRNDNVVRTFERLGTWTGERLEIPLDLSRAAARGRDGCAVIVQEGRSGPILGASAMPLGGLQ